MNDHPPSSNPPPTAFAENNTGTASTHQLLTEKVLPKGPTSQNVKRAGRLRRAPRDFVIHALSPRIAVVSTSDADDICRENNMNSFCELLRPFGDRIPGKVTVRDNQGMPQVIEPFYVRFAELANLEGADEEAVNKTMADAVRQENKDFNDKAFHTFRNKQDVDDRYLNTPLEDVTPWYTSFRDLFFEHMHGISEHETFDHPVACILAITANNPEPLNALLRLYNITSPAPVFDKGFVEPNILKFYVLVHDNVKGNMAESEHLLGQMRKTFGAHCHLLRINSLPPPTVGPPLQNDLQPSITLPTSLRETQVPDIWSEYQQNAHLRNIKRSTPTPHHARRDSTSSSIIPSSPTTRSHSEFPTKSKPDGIITTGDNDGLGLGSVTADSKAESEKTRGLRLSPDDFGAIQALVRECLTGSVLPWMERQALFWNEQVASSRRGITGRLFSAGRRYFGASRPTSGVPVAASTSTLAASSGNSPPSSSGGVSVYPFSSPEFQMRKLADYAFMLRDYKFAQSTYETARKEFSSDRAYKYVAGALQMSGLCGLMIEGQALTPAKMAEIDHNLEQAVSNYYLGRCQASIPAMKATLLYYELLKSRQGWRESTAALVRMTGENSDLRSALLLEQAGHAFVRAWPAPLVRKYAFHLIMAGHRYSKCAQREHAYRCYHAACAAYEGKSWSLIEDHVHFALGRQAFHLSDMENSIKYFLKLMRESKQPEAQHITYLKEFLYIYKQYATQNGEESTKVALPHLPIPTIVDSGIRVSLSNTSSANIEIDETWKQMERDLIEDPSRGSNDKRRMALEKSSGRTVCAVGEPVLVQMEMQNPMLVPISLSSVVLECQYLNETSENSTQALAGNSERQALERITKDDVTYLRYPEFELQLVDGVNFEKSENKLVSLKLIPLKEGSVRILGIHYVLNSVVHGYYEFKKHGKRLNDTKENKMQVTYAPDQSLNLLVTSPMPLLDIVFHKIPRNMLSGELCQVTLEINNRGERGLTNLSVKMSHPSFFCVGDPSMMDQAVYGEQVVDLLGTTSPNGAMDKTETVRVSNALFNASVSEIPLPAAQSTATKSSTDGILAPGRTTLVPVWMRGDKIGKHAFRLLFVYESVEKNRVMSYRTLRYSLKLNVSPSLKMNAFTRPSANALHEFILGVEIENLQPNTNFQLLQISSVSPAWRITPTEDNAVENASKTIIQARQTTFTYYRVSRRDASINTDQSPEEYTAIALENLLLGEEGRNRAGPPEVTLHYQNIPFTQSISCSSSPLRELSRISRVQWRTARLPELFPSIPKKKHSHVFTLYGTNDLDLIAYWKIPDRNIMGHQYLIGMSLGVQQNPLHGRAANLSGGVRALYEETAREKRALINTLLKNKAFKDESPLRVMMQSKDIYEHDFGDDGLCIIPITISIKNCSWSRVVSFHLEMISPDSGDKGSRAGPQSAQGSITATYTNFHWAGATASHGSLGPDELVEIVVSACFSCPGVFDISRWRLTLHPEKQKETAGAKGKPSAISAGGKQMVSTPTLQHIVTILDGRR